MFAGNGGGPQGQAAAVAGPSHGQMRAAYAPPGAQGHYERPAYAEYGGFTQSIRPGSRPGAAGGAGQMASGSVSMQDGTVQGGHGGAQQGQVHNPGHPQRPPSVVVSSPYGPQPSTSSPHMAPRGQNVAPSPHLQHQRHQQPVQARQQQLQPGSAPAPYSNTAPSPYSNSPATYSQSGTSPYPQHQQPPHAPTPHQQQQFGAPFSSQPPHSKASYAPHLPQPSPTRPPQQHLSTHVQPSPHETSPHPHARHASYPQPSAQQGPHAQPTQFSQQRDYHGESDVDESQRRRVRAYTDGTRAPLERHPERERRFADDEVVPVSAPLPTVGSGYTAAPMQQQGYPKHVPRAVQEVAARYDLPEDEDQRTRFHAYLLDYLQKAGFLSTAAALLSDSPGIPTYSPSSGRSFVLPRPRLRQATSGNSSLFFTSPSALSPLPLGPPPSQPISPRKDTFGADAGPSNADTVESTASTASTATHFGFDGSVRGTTDDEDGAPSPAKDASGAGSPSKRTSQANSRNISGSSISASGDPSSVRIPAARVQIETDQGFLYEWWNVFWDVFQAKASQSGRNANPAAARSFVQASSAAVDVAMQKQSNAHAQARLQAQARAQANTQALAQAQAQMQQQQAQAPARRSSVHAGGPPTFRRRSSMVAQPQQQQPPPQPNTPRAPIPLRQQDNPNLTPAQPESTGRSAREPSAPTDEIGSTPGGNRRSSRHKSALAHAQALQRQQEEQAEIDARMAQARVHAQQIHSRHVLPHSSGAGAPGTPASSAQAASPIQSFSPNALNYNPDRLQQTTEAYNRYRASLVASQQTQLEMAKRQVSKDNGRRSSAAAAEGSMPPPTTTQRTSTSLDNTPRNKELPLPPTPSASGASAEASAADKTAETAASPADAPAANTTASKRRRVSMANSISETRESKKRVTTQSPAAEAVDASAGQPPASDHGVRLVSRELSAALLKDPLPPGEVGTLYIDSGDNIDNYLVSDPSASLEAGDNSGFAGASLPFAMPSDASGQLSLDQIDQLLLSTVDAAGPPHSAANDVQVGDSATFDYNEFLTAFGSEGPASYDPTQSFDLAV